MKKIIISLLLLITLMLSLCACNSGPKFISNNVEPPVIIDTPDNPENIRKEGEDLIIGEKPDDVNLTSKENETKETSSSTEEVNTTETVETPETIEEPILKETIVDPIYEEKILFKIEMMNGDVMEGELYPKLAPITVENFVNLIRSNFYDGLIFHRVIPGFMIQGGGYNENLEEKESSEIKGEFTENGVVNNLSHTRGVISMARTVIPDSASSQFFIVHANSTFLDGKYAAFGKITSGLEIIDKIATTETEEVSNVMTDVPKDAQIIKTITIIE